MNKLRDWFNQTPCVDVPTKEELSKATARLKKFTKTIDGGSYVERPKRTNAPQLPKIKDYNPNEPMESEVPEFRVKPMVVTTKTVIPFGWNREIKEDKPMKKDIMKEIEWEYSEEGAKELRHLFAMWHLNDEVWQRQRKKAINLAVYGEEDPFNNRPYYHILTFSDELGFKLSQYPKHQKEEAHAFFNNYNEAWHNPQNILFFEGEEIGHIILGGNV